MIIAKAIEGKSREDARSCLYYTARYIKQAENFDRYEKDIFEDEEHNLPSALVHEMTLQLIKAIEEKEGTSAAQFDDETVIRLLDEITSIEASLSPELSDAEIERGALLAAEMLPPKGFLVD
ncbi:MAG TPA: hypothetical protein DIT93_05340 [Pelagibacterium sp.]|uniref:hypothetical protein n=1 Tax=uncultured Pelagibacterium sp. TaxID=1159875 RepID=UPI000C51DE33|nr:hypothetical protein [Pelagibacterium sp.]HCO54424.1 hypothetical protein [Pelagibacterium sp.]|tara:strand:- start:95 stop:460 length:366 start_codon:yes stop_codon:yes gene_type:complete